MARIGLQLYTLKEEAAKNFLGTLERVAEIGYGGVEFAGYFNTPPDTLKQTLERLHLQAMGTHIGLDMLKENLEEVIEYAQAIQCPAVICPGFWGVDLKAEATYHQMGEFFHAVSEQCQANGLEFWYHIHGHEFETFGGQYGLDIILQEAKNMLLEPDIFWIQDAGLDPLETIRTYKDRCAALHLKDMKSLEERHDIEVGDGCLDTLGIIREAHTLLLDWLVVEQEYFTIPPFESIAISLQNIRNMCEQSL